VTLVPIGPLTNIALLLAAHPDVKPRIARIVAMGGAFSGGNTTESAGGVIAYGPGSDTPLWDRPVWIHRTELDALASELNAPPRQTLDWRTLSRNLTDTCHAVRIQRVSPTLCTENKGEDLGPH
jgi:inosine-uridine nucleoside N-ribohydrolase